MKVVVIAGDEGVLLRPLTCNLPKAKIEILGDALLFLALEKIICLDVTEIILILNYKANEVETMFPDGEFRGIPVTTVFEEVNSGTVGCIKNTINSNNETVMVLNLDSYFEFDFVNAFSRHIANMNDATIICKRQDDPRNFGVVTVDEKGIVSDFIEKPAWSEVVSDVVSCGIYFLEPDIIETIPDNIVCNSTKDLFTRLIYENFKIGAYISNEYWYPLYDIDDYKKIQFDILRGKTSKKLPFVAEGIFTKSSVPNGNFVIIPPVFFGDNVQIENGAVIGPFTIIGEGSLVSKGSKIRESVLLKSVYVSSGCSVNGSVLCEGVSVKKGASVFEDSVIGENSVIGEDSIITNGVLVWPNKTIENRVTVTENVKYSQPINRVIQINDIIFGDFGVELTPEKTARLGAAIGTLFDGVRVGVGIDGETNSLALKCGILGGLISVGAKSFDLGKSFYSQMFYYSIFCDTDIVIFISGGESGVSLSLCEKGGVALSRANSRKLELILKRNEFKRCAGGDCQSVSVIDSISEMYINEICRQFDDLKILQFSCLFLCGNQISEQCVKRVFSRLGIKNENEDFIFKINNLGTKITVIEKSISFPHEKILAVVAHNEMKNGTDVALPWDAPQIITTLGNALGRKTYRFSEYSEPQSESSKIKTITTNQLWSRDAVLLMFRLIKIMIKENKTLKELAEELPEFYVAKKVMEIDVSPALISKELLGNNFKADESGGVTLNNEKGIAKVRSDSNGKRLKIITEAVTAELADELCGEIEKLISIDIDC